jgi:hypothetical protein
MAQRINSQRQRQARQAASSPGIARQQFDDRIQRFSTVRLLSSGVASATISAWARDDRAASTGTSYSADIDLVRSSRRNSRHSAKLVNERWHRDSLAPPYSSVCICFGYARRNRSLAFRGRGAHTLPPGRSLKAQHGGHFVVRASVAGDRGAPSGIASTARPKRCTSMSTDCEGRKGGWSSPALSMALTAGISPPLLTDVGGMRPGRRSQPAKQQSSMSRSGERGMLLIQPLAVGILTRLKS